eukprot:comp57646_c0_seq1/m.47810 comp57646_c0_seq1/g.47810  ORF comp57646_c0_seq1/g.47810 comp57646_c0_seq1/m.47810 type:complete len:385 (-) comp57646_c0_seq1:616-1770(-)
MPALTQQVSDTRTLRFNQDYLEPNFILMALPKELAKEVDNITGLCFRGDEADVAVLCTENTTYEVKVAETSNALLVLAPEEMGTVEEKETVIQPVRTTAKWYLELKKISPRLDKLRSLLTEAPYAGPEEDVPTSKLHTWEDLLHRVQASEGELREALKTLHAAHINGYWRCVTEAYQDKVMDLILSTATANDWPLDRIPALACHSDLAEYEVCLPLVLHCLESYGEEIGQTGRDDDGDLHMADEERYFKLALDKVARFRGLQILRVGQSQKMVLKDFMAVWQETLPPGCTADVNLLKGYALTDTSVKGDAIFLYSKHSLPLDPTACLATLFQFRPRWEINDIRPYVEDLCARGQTVEAFLLKHARCSTDLATGKRMVNSKYDKS